ncbi:class 1 isoprenoid biosynthesis enzyme [uncultured Sunxiuqinia sp.]|uniref:class 1 isoprenoid biosynthesis enzyme n=1 Tax=uncultured Sunxiuqinia sp. TaxID=1573825 RepID=UPI002AA72EFB|nr:class 1 isoprenoid biosynthesis enzyme [uncultured Sunxiuqinia sp.]
MEILQLTNKFADIWYQTNDSNANFGNPIGRREKKSKEAFVDRFFMSMKKLDEDEISALAEFDWLDEFILTQLQTLFQDAFSYEHEEINLMFSAEMMKSTKAFSKIVRDLDSELPIESVFQACRNVWIMNGLQLILGYPVELTQSIFAYSMLYPYTDNYVDDPSISTLDKYEFSERFANRIAGKPVEAKNEQERKIYHMIELIEGQFDRNDYPEVFESLLGIHRAQTDSMQLQHDTVTPEQALNICLAKGGASVLADGYLVAGKLTDEEKDFLFGYGAYLQLLDDIQDVKEDLEGGLMTTFSLLAKDQKLDSIVYKTYNFGEHVLDHSKEILDRVDLDFKGLLQKSILLFFVESVVVDAQYYSKLFQKELENFSPLSFEYVTRRRKFFIPQKHILLEKLEKHDFLLKEQSKMKEEMLNS